jgi:L-threonylcarbamoyladenylate synthase
VWLFAPNESAEVAAAVAALAETPAARVGALLLTASPALPADARIERMPDDAAGYARRLYAVLHAMDDAGCTLILIERPPPTAPWAAVTDRLTRAAA